MGHKILVINLPLGRLSVDVCMTPHLEVKAIWESSFGIAPLPGSIEPESVLRCSITSEPRCCIALDSIALC